MIGSIIDYDPQVDSYKNEVNRIINQTYLEFFTAHPWKFSQKSIDIYTNPDVEDTAADMDGSTMESKYPVNLVTLSSSTLFNDNRVGQMRREGDVVVISGSDHAVNNGLFIMDKYNDTNEIRLSKYSEQNRVHWVGNANQTVTVKVQQRYLKMPNDCVGILSVGIRNLEEAGVGTNALGHVYPITRREDEELNLRDDFTGTPTTWIPYDQPPDTVSRHVRDYIPRAGKDFNISSTTASGSWPAGTYEFKIAYKFHEEIGPASDVQEITLNGNQAVVFDTLDTTKLGFYGMRKVIYFRIKSATGLDSSTFEEPYFRCLSDFILYPGGPSFRNLEIEDDDVQWTMPYQNAAWNLGTIDAITAIPRERQYLDNHWRIRLHPRPATQTPMRIRYMFYPTELIDDYDTPQSPSDTHRYLVYRACQELFIKHKNDNQALYYEKKAEEEMRKIERKWLTERSTYYIKDGFKSGPMRLRPFRNLTHGTGQDGT